MQQNEMGNDPLGEFERWYAEAEAVESVPANSVALATATAGAIPSVRYVLFKGLVDGGFRFFTNYGSRKGSELDENPHASLAFYWHQLERQVRVGGPVERLSLKQSAAYFATRDRSSQLGAWASRQSSVIEDRSRLERKMVGYERRFSGKEVSLPPWWGGFRLLPRSIEFWAGRSGRLHDRWLFSRREQGWACDRLSP